MSKKTNTCLICLRTDKELKIIDSKLSDFHDEFCDYSINDSNPKYCSECEYLLRKTYKFRQKCLKACQILEKWKKSGANRKPLSSLCTLLPSSLSVWTSENAHIYDYVEEPLPLEPQTYLVPLITETERNRCENVDIDSQDVLANSQSIAIKQEADDNEKVFTEEDSAKCLKEYIICKNENSTIEEVMLNGDDTKCDVSNDILSDCGFSDDDDDTLLCLKDNINREKEKKSKRKRSAEGREDNKIKRRKSVKKEVSKKSVVKMNNCKEAKENDDDDKKTRFHTRKAICRELNDLLCVDNSEKRDTNEEKNVKICKKRAYSKERLIQEIGSKFASCGELKTTDGTVIDKEFIVQCLGDRVTEFVLRQLYNAVHRKLDFKPKALKLFKCIQNKYKCEYSSVFDIEYLNTKEKVLQEFDKRKTYESYVAAEYKCEVCYQGFKFEKKYLNHKKCHEESAGDIVCAICKVRQRRTKSLIGHMNNAHEAVYRCKLCPLVTYYKTSMQNHYEQHKGIKYTCKQCHTVFSSVSAIRTHMSYRHARDHVCTSCGQAYNTRTGLQIHITKEHQKGASVSEGEFSVKCGECPLSFATNEARYRHERVTHKLAARGRPPGGPTRRIRSDRPRKQPVLTCRVCNSVGNSWGWLSLHFSLEHPTADLEQTYADKNKHLCDICGKSFSTIYTLQAHLNVHSGVRPYACDTCSASFHRALSLRLHRLVHGPPSKPCAVCGKQFRSHSNLYNHMRSHIGDRRYKCDICGKGFIHRSSLNEHVRGVHKNIRRVRKRGVTDATAKGH